MSLEISFLSMLLRSVLLLINHVDRLPLGSCCLLRVLGMDTNFDFISIRESDVLKITAEMSRLSKTDHGFGTVVYDSGTAILDDVQSQGRLQEAAAKAKGEKFNLDNIHKNKADTMRVLRMAALKLHCNVLWIFHLEDGMQSGKARVRTTIPTTELERLKSNLNAIMTIVKDAKNTRGMRIEWSRYNNNAAAGQTIWDTEGMWRGAPDRIHDFIRDYKGDEQYNGNAYSTAFLMKYLAEKNVNFLDVAQMKSKLGVVNEPAWWDRKSWAVYIEKGMKLAVEG